VKNTLKNKRYRFLNALLNGTKSLFDIVVEISFQSIFHLKIYQNIIFLFFKIYF